MCFNYNRIGRKFGIRKMHVSRPIPVACATVHSKAVVLLLLVVAHCFYAPIFCVGSVFCTCFVMQYLASFLV